ncbi:hypothetical protein [Glycomyces arizonensis]|uniref:hypothetical protein n=1 Tax=Glycomyces arizonensis TaxID=256035 RepID=UPI0003FD3B62|nr:hypothetical protein [Glycomyces arizonensis]
MGRNNKRPRLIELWHDPREVVFQHDERGTFATDRTAIWSLHGLPLADPRLVPNQDGFYRVGKTVVTRLSKQINPEREGHLADKFTQWAADDADRPWQPVTLTAWRLHRCRVGITEGGPVLIGEHVADLCDRYGPLALALRHADGEDHKLRLAWSRIWRRTEYGGDYDQHTAVAIVQPATMPHSGPARTVLEAITTSHQRDRTLI